MVNYLQNMASGHLAKNANGHLVNNCDNYVVFTQCTAACPDDPPTSDCGGGDTITSTPALIWGWSASLIGSVAKVDGKCYTVEWGDDGTPAVAVTIQSTYDCCEECCTDEPNYLLTQCDISCPNTDCDGEEDSIIIAATSLSIGSQTEHIPPTLPQQYKLLYMSYYTGSPREARRNRAGNHPTPRYNNHRFQKPFLTMSNLP